MNDRLETIKVLFPDGTQYEVQGMIEGNKVFDGDGDMMFEVDLDSYPNGGNKW